MAKPVSRNAQGFEPETSGLALLRVREASLPKVLCTVTAPMRSGHKFCYAGGYADRDGAHVHAKVFAGDGVARKYEFPPTLIRRLMADPVIKIAVDMVKLAEAEKEGGEQLTELDIIKARLAQVEGHNRLLQEKIARGGTPDAETEGSGVTPAVETLDEEDPAVDPAAEAEKATPTAKKGKGKKAKPATAPTE